MSNNIKYVTSLPVKMAGDSIYPNFEALPGLKVILELPSVSADEKRKLYVIDVVGSDWPDMSIWFPSNNVTEMSSQYALALANQFSPHYQQIEEGSTVVYGDYLLNEETGILYRQITKNVAYSEIEDVFRQERDTLKTSAIQYIKQNPTCTIDDLLLFGEDKEHLIRASYLMNLYIQGAAVKGMIASPTWDDFRNFVVNHTIEELMQI